MLELDEEDYALLGGGRNHEHDWREAMVLERRRLLLLDAKQAYEETAKGKQTRAAYNALYSTRPKRKQRRNRVRAKKPRLAPALKGYARIKAWRDANPEKAKKIEQRYKKSAKGRAAKSRSNKKHHEKRKQR